MRDQDNTLSQWNGTVTIRFEGCLRAQVIGALELLIGAVDAKLFGPVYLALAADAMRSDSIRCDCARVPNTLWLLLSNLLCAQQAEQARLILEGDSGSRMLMAVPRLYSDVPGAAMPCRLDELTDVMNEFFIQFAFVRSLTADEREAFCMALDAWVALVDAGGFPMAESLTLPSAIAGASSRFEDTATAAIHAEGMAAASSGVGLLVQLANHWHSRIEITEMALEHTGS